MHTLKLAISVFAAFAFCGLWAPANASGDKVSNGIISEMRLGIYDHESNLFGTRYETGKPDVNVEVLFNAPDWLQWMAHPRLNIGANINTGSGTSIGYSGFVWDANITDALFIEGAFGAAIHDGQTEHKTSQQLDLGCRVMFHESGTIGYRVTESTSVMLTVDHMSNASFCSPNPGITDAGVRLGYSF
ncbi:MAG: acyloxyacyl hydrolase [Parvibaculaceae bacterium]